MIKNACKIYKNDLKTIFTNYAALVVFLALCILPSLYAWFNIKASWDPYAQEATSQIKVGVINNDAGAEFNGEKINIGEKVVDNLKDNKKMGWQFGTEKDITEKVKSGEYYASITIPKDFSSEIISIVSDEVIKGKLIYTVNEKINAIAPKITDKGATGVQASINETVIETISDTVLSTAKELGIELDNIYLPKLEKAIDILAEVQDKFDEINRYTDLTAETLEKADSLLTDINNYIPTINQLFIDIEGLTRSINTFISTSNEILNKLSPSIKEDIRLISESCNQINTYIDSITKALQSGANNTPQMIDSANNRLDSIQLSITAVQDLLKGINKNNKLDALINSLEINKNDIKRIQSILTEVKKQVEAGGNIDYSKFDTIKEVSNRVNKNAQDMYNNYDNDIHNKVSDIFNEAATVGNEVLTTIQDAQRKIPEVQSLITSMLETLDGAQEGIANAQEMLPTIEEKINEVSEKLNEINDNEEIKDILKLIENNVEERVEFLSNPVEIQSKILYPMNNYGSAMTPFYSVLAIWVGMTFLVSMLTLHVHGDYKEVEVYFGKLFTFGTIALIQSIIIGLGDLYLLKIYCVNPGLLMIGLIFTSMTFLLVVYTLTSVFGNVGKVVAIIFMILQVAGSGGTFPIQLIPKFFQKLNPIFPFTYAISFAREAIGGVYKPTLIKDIVVMLAFIGGSLVVGVFLKKPFNKLMKGFTEKYEESGLGE